MGTLLEVEGYSPFSLAFSACLLKSLLNLLEASVVQYDSSTEERMASRVYLFGSFLDFIFLHHIGPIYLLPPCQFWAYFQLFCPTSLNNAGPTNARSYLD